MLWEVLSIYNMDGTQTLFMFSPRCKSNPRFSPRNGAQTRLYPNYCFVHHKAMSQNL